jgi:hypothetical protein
MLFLCATNCKKVQVDVHNPPGAHFKRCLILFDFVVIVFCFACFWQVASFIKAHFYHGSCFIFFDA